MKRPSDVSRGGDSQEMPEGDPEKTVDARFAHTIRRLWRFARGDEPATAFEPWAYGADGLEELLGAARYLELVGTRFSDGHAVQELRNRLRNWLHEIAPQKCRCISWKDDQEFPMGFDTPPDILDSLVELRQRTPWLGLSRCQLSGEHWYVAVDTMNDDYHLHRLTGDEAREILDGGPWPATFDELRAVWPRTG